VLLDLIEYSLSCVYVKHLFDYVVLHVLFDSMCLLHVYFFTCSVSRVLSDCIFFFLIRYFLSCVYVKRLFECVAFQVLFLFHVSVLCILSCVLFLVFDSIACVALFDMMLFFKCLCEASV